jgi:uncharacterized membrane protein
MCRNCGARQPGGVTGRGPGYRRSGGQGPQPHGGPQRPVSPNVNYSNLYQDAMANKSYGVLSYIVFLVFISLIAAPKQSRYARFHANQGLVLFLLSGVPLIIIIIIDAVTKPHGWEALLWDPTVHNTIFISLYIIVSAFLVTFSILGIVNASKNTINPLPGIGRIKIIK